jgi:hypothetical protein
MPPYGSSTGRRANKSVKKAAGMVAFILTRVASFLFADAASALPAAYIADNGILGSVVTEASYYYSPEYLSKNEEARDIDAGLTWELPVRAFGLVDKI